MDVIVSQPTKSKSVAQAESENMEVTQDGDKQSLFQRDCDAFAKWGEQHHSQPSRYSADTSERQLYIMLVHFRTRTNWGRGGIEQ